MRRIWKRARALGWWLPARKRPFRYRPEFESLEDRCVPAWIPIGPAPQLDYAAPRAPAGEMPSSGRISALTVAGTGAHQTLYLGSAGGGVWSSANFTGVTPTYTPLTDNIDMNGMVGGIQAGAIDTGSVAVADNRDGSINAVYVGTGEANYSYDSRYGTGILKWTPGDTNFKLVATGSIANPVNNTPANPTAFVGRSISQIIIDPRNNQWLYAAVVRSASALVSGPKKGSGACSP